jgi:hypothetical protein
MGVNFTVNTTNFRNRDAIAVRSSGHDSIADIGQSQAQHVKADRDVAD